ncbi:hypothetical protein [Brevibacterium oceani]|uniref:hypothetical protein n=1 Tax=Brevibacterium oceani TaxID=358099 RepID=UPI0015E7AB7A|nr:hypothetical protein [Brevibacterium oceani]
MGKRQKKLRDSQPGFRGVPNPDLARAMVELRKSSAAQRHTPKPRKGTRRQREQQAIRDQRRNGSSSN